MNNLKYKSSKIRIEKFHALVSYFKILKPLLLSHHPDCEKFKNHSIKIRNNKYCIGCFIGYPTAILGILSIELFNFLEMFTPHQYFMIGFILISSFLLSIFGLTKNKKVKIIQKSMIGLGASFLFRWIWNENSSILQNFLFSFLLFGLLTSIFNLYHAFGIYKTCKKCRFSLDWETCPGIKKYKEALKKI